MKTLLQWDSSAGWYDKNMGEEGDALNKDVIRPFVIQLLGDLHGKSLLDSGCGSGYLSAELSKTAASVIGTDFSPSFIALCRDKFATRANLSFTEHDALKKMPFTDGFFDIILSKMVLQYVEKLDTFAGESYRTLRTGGKLLVIVDHPFHAQYYFAQEKAGKPNKKYPALRDYFSREKQTKLSLWGKVNLTWYPKTVADYILPFLKAQLKLLNIIELPEEKNGVKIPRILALLFER